MKLRVLLADDHTMYRTALRMTLENAPDIEIVAEVADGQGALEGVGQTRPDVVCLDIRMPGMNGIEATRQILAIHPEARIIGMSANADVSLVADMINAGAFGFVVKSGASAELLQAIRLAGKHQRYLSPEVAHSLSKSGSAGSNNSPRGPEQAD